MTEEFDKGLVSAAIQASTPAPLPKVLDLKGVEGSAPKLATIIELNSRKNQLKDQLKEIEDQLEEHIGDLKEMLGGEDSPVEEFRYAGKPLGTWKRTVRRQLDQKKLREILPAEIFESLKHEVTFRTFKLTIPTGDDE